MDTFTAIREGRVKLTDLLANNPPESLSWYLPAALQHSEATFVAAVTAGIPLPCCEAFSDLILECYRLNARNALAVIKPSTETLTELLNYSIAALDDRTFCPWLDVSPQELAGWAAMIQDGAVLSLEAKTELEQALGEFEPKVEGIKALLGRE